jgi:biopolymer transport protein ExbD
MSAKTKSEKRIAPFINVTPLIDVLLVLLIIFMVVSPLKPARFVAKVPSPPNPDDRVRPSELTLVVTIQSDRSLKLNGVADMGTVEDTSKLSTKLFEVFAERKQNHTYRYELLNRVNLPDDRRVEKTVYVKAPRSISYGEVAKVIDGIKGAGADPIGLQLDFLD